jgi:hypothetical protein
VNEAYFFCLGLIGILFFIAVGFLTKLKQMKESNLLDFIEESKDNFELIKSYRQFYSALLFGFKNSHPICISLAFNQLGFDRWSTNEEICITFAKFIAFYPEETQRFNWLYHHIVSHKFKSISSNLLLIEMADIVQRRESNLSSNVKKKLNHLQKLISRAHLKLRNIWDSIIQGNVNELESEISQTFKSIERIEKEFSQLFRQFPNCRFIYRLYSRFKLEICADQNSSDELNQQINFMRRGTNIVPDEAHRLGILQFPLFHRLSRGVINKIVRFTLMIMKQKFKK